MIQQETILKVADNSGAKQILCIGIPGGSDRRYAKPGDIITGSIKKVSAKSNIKKKDIVKAIILRTKKEITRPDGTLIRFSDNAVAIVTKDGDPCFTRIMGPIDRKVRECNPKVANLAKEIY